MEIQTDLSLNRAILATARGMGKVETVRVSGGGNRGVVDFENSRMEEGCEKWAATCWMGKTEEGWSEEPGFPPEAPTGPQVQMWSQG